MTAAVLTVAIAGVAVAAGQPAEATAAPAGIAAAAASAGTASNGWAGLAGQVPTPGLRWMTCQKIARCATAELPLDYHDPNGAKTTVALPALSPPRTCRSLTGSARVPPATVR